MIFVIISIVLMSVFMANANIFERVEQMLVAGMWSILLLRELLCL
jgi:hypothetical protein